MQKSFSICLSPYDSPIEVIDNLVVSISAPYTENSVAVVINPNIIDYEEKKSDPNLNIAQMMVMKDTDETIKTMLNLAGHPEQRFSYGGSNYNLKFLSTSKINKEGQDFLSFNFNLETYELTSLQKVGSVIFSIGHPHPDWISNRNGYKFGPFQFGNLYVTTFKDPDGMLRILLNGFLGQNITLRKSISDLKTEKLRVAITWENDIMKLYINGQIALEQSMSA